MKNILKKSNNVVVTYNNSSYKIKNCKEKLLEILEGSYTSPSYVTVRNHEIVRAKEQGLWIEMFFETKQIFKDLEFDSILINLKPKYNFLNIIRCNNNEYSGKCINFNLAINTTDLYKVIMNEIEEKHEK